MAQAIVRARGEYGFPWPMQNALRLLKVLPNAVFDSIGRRVRR
jgi:hypothetical protein